MITVRIPIGLKKEGGIEWDSRAVPFRPGIPLSDYIPKDFRSVVLNRIICSGKSIPDKPNDDCSPCDVSVFKTYYPKLYDEITIIPAVQDPATISFLTAVAIKVAIAAAMAAVSMMVSRLLAPTPEKTSLPNNPPTTQGWDGIKNTYGPGHPMPVHFGENRSGVEVLYWVVRQEYVKKNGRKINLSMTQSWAMFIGSFGRPVHAISNVCINNNPYTNYGEDVEVYTRLGTAGQTPVPGFNEQGVTYDADTEISDSSPFIYTTSGTDLTAVELLFAAPQGIAQFDSKGNMLPYKIRYTVRYKKHSAGAWTDLGEHEARGNTTNACRWYKRIDELDEDQYDFEMQRTSVIGGSKYGKLFLHSVTEFTEVAALAYEGLSTVWVKALAMEQLSDQPFTVTADIQGIECPTWDGAAWTAGNSYTDNPAAHCREVMVNDDVTTCNGVDLPPWGFGPWCGEAQVDDDSWGAFYEYCAEKNLLKWSEAFEDDDWVNSNVTVTPDSGAAPNDPDDRTFCQTLTAAAGNATLLQVYTGASAERTFSIFLKRKTGTGNIQLTQDGGVSWTTVTITSTDFTRVDLTDTVENPSCGIRIVTSGDEVYAFGAMLNIGDSAFSYLCSEATAELPRHTNNIVWNSRKTMEGILDDILFACRGKRFRFRGKQRVKARVLTDPTQKFNSGNLKKWRMERGKEIRDYNALHVTYISKDQNYTPTSFQVDLGITPLKVKDISVYGINNAREAYRQARFMLLLAYYTIEKPRLTASIDAILCMPGDTIRFASPSAGIGIAEGRVKINSTALNIVKLDQEVTIEATKTYQVVIRFSGGANPDLIQTRDVTTGAGTTDILTVSSNFSQLPAKGDLITFGETDLVTKTYWLDDWDSDDEEVIDLICSEDNPLIYKDWGTPPVEETVSYPYADTPANQIQVMNVAEETYMGEDGLWTTNLRIFWRQPSSDVTKGFYRSADLYYAIPTVENELGMFETDETWVGGTADTDWPEYREKEGTQSRKVLPIAINTWTYSYRNVSLDLSAATKEFFALWIYISEILKAYNGSCVQIVFETDGSNYFVREIDRDNLDSGYQLDLSEKADYEELKVGAPDWANITKLKLGFKIGKAQGYAVFDTWRCLSIPDWIYLANAPGMDFYWPNVAQNTFFLFKAQSVSGLGAVNQVDPAYAGILTKGKTDYPMDVEFTAACNFEGENPYLEWTAVTDEDFEGIELRLDTNFGTEDDNLIEFVKKGLSFEWKKYPKWAEARGWTEGQMRNPTIYIAAKDTFGNYSLTPDSVTLPNAVPDMSAITPTLATNKRGKNLIIGWPDYSQPADLAKQAFKLFLRAGSAPTLTDDTYFVAWATRGSDHFELSKNIERNVQYYVDIEPWDIYGKGVACSG